jgi:L-lactate dehydrogenase complex protein LldE
VNVTLFVPCYVDQLAPEVGLATARVLERVGCRVEYDPRQTCCGQPFLTSGAATEAARLARGYLERFAGSEAIVCPSASCVATVRKRFAELDVVQDAAAVAVREHTYELGEFLVDHLGTTRVGAHFPHRVALLQSCHGLRELGSKESVNSIPPTPGPAERLLRAVDGIELLLPERPDECCGFGGAFSVKFPEVSARIGYARLDALTATGADYVTATDVSCLLHLDGLRRRRGAGPQPIHLAQLLDSGPPA